MKQERRKRILCNIGFPDLDATVPHDVGKKQKKKSTHNRQCTVGKWYRAVQIQLGRPSQLGHKGVVGQCEGPC